MKKVLLLMFCALMGFVLNAQVSKKAQSMGSTTRDLEVYYETNFDDVSSGAYVAQSYPTWWDTWSNQPGTSEDGLITDDQASSSPQSAKLSWGTDLIFNAGSKTEGAYNIDFNMYIPNNGVAYFNLLQTFTGDQDGLWAVGIHFNVSGSDFPAKGTYVHQDGAIYPFTFPYDTWFPISIYVNLDIDLAVIYINDVLVLDWQYSTQESGGAGEKILEKVDFFPPIAGSVFYIDDFSFTEGGDPPPPPTVSIMPDDELRIWVQPESSTLGDLYVISEDASSLSAKWSTYIDYAPLEIGEGDEFTLAIGDLYTAPDDGIGYSIAIDKVEIAIKLLPIDYANQLGGELKHLAFYIAEMPPSDLTFRVYGQGLAENVPGDILAEEVLLMADFIENDWNWVDIDPVQLTGGEYWVSVAMTSLPANAHPLTTLSGPALYGGDWIKDNDGAWSKLSEGSDLDYNWALQVKGDGQVQKVWGQLDIYYGNTLPASETKITVTVNSTDFEEDTYTANIVVLTNDPENPRFDLPLIMVVSEEAPPSNADMKEITVNGIPATPTSELEYEILLSCTTQIVIVATPEDEEADVTGDEGEHTVKCLSVNNYTFTVTAQDGVTKKVYKLKVSIEDDPPAISEIDNTIKLFPNPVSDYLNITSDYTIETIAIYDLTGKMVKQVKQPGVSVNLSDLSAGYYLLKVTTEQGDAMHKFVKE